MIIYSSSLHSFVISYRLPKTSSGLPHPTWHLCCHFSQAKYLSWIDQCSSVSFLNFPSLAFLQKELYLLLFLFQDFWVWNLPEGRWTSWREVSLCNEILSRMCVCSQKALLSDTLTTYVTYPSLHPPPFQDGFKHTFLGLSGLMYYWSAILFSIPTGHRLTPAVS